MINNFWILIGPYFFDKTPYQRIETRLEKVPKKSKIEVKIGY